LRWHPNLEPLGSRDVLEVLIGAEEREFEGSGDGSALGAFAAQLARQRFEMSI
jgi:hypothetical protein